MAISYSKIIKHPRIFLRLFGITSEQIEIIAKKLEPLWQKNVISKYKRPGRNYKLSLQQMLMMLLLYYRTYTYSTMMQIGFMFGVDDSRVCRIIKILEPLIAGLVAIKKNRELTYEESAQMIDATEQIIKQSKQEKGHPKNRSNIFLARKKFQD